jgi:hypothetical protein
MFIKICLSLLLLAALVTILIVPFLPEKKKKEAK